MNEKETLQLLTAFFHEALRFLNISEDDSKKSIGKVAVLAFFRQIITRILKVLVAMALVGLLLPFIQRYFSSMINKEV